MCPIPPLSWVGVLGEPVHSIPGLDAMEPHNRADPREMNQRAIKVALRLDLPSVGGSDCHRVAQAGRSFRYFSNRIGDMNDLIRELKSGQCRGEICKTVRRLE